MIDQAEVPQPKIEIVDYATRASDLQKYYERRWQEIVDGGKSAPKQPVINNKSIEDQELIFGPKLLKKANTVRVLQNEFARSANQLVDSFKAGNIHGGKQINIASRIADLLEGITNNEHRINAIKALARGVNSKNLIMYSETACKVLADIPSQRGKTAWIMRTATTLELTEHPDYMRMSYEARLRDVLQEYNGQLR